VFFVISGYLISSHILEELEARRFTIASFYERRIRRIFPALFVALLASGVLAVLFLMPSELVDYGWSMGAAALSVSNVLFYTQSGYFAAPSSTKPLLHTWSLGVEEQFYIVLPLLLALLWRLNRRAIPGTVTLLAAASLVLSEWLARSNVDAAYYLAPSRAWELLLGTLLALRLVPAMTSGFVRESAAASGVGLILLSGIYYGTSTPFPGLAAVPPCLGAALVIAAGQHGTSLTTRALSLRPIVVVGLMSYSLYLWHWPVYVFSSMGVFPLGFGGRTLKLILLAASFACAFLSWRFVELPARVGKLRPDRRKLFFGAGLMIAGVCVAAGILVFSGGLPNRFPAAAVRVASYIKYDPANASRTGKCMIEPSHTFGDFDRARCAGKRQGMRNYLLLGDSHAAALWFGLSRTYGNVHVMQVTGSNCRIRPVDGGPSENCRQLMSYAFNEVISDPSLDGVVVAARWTAADLGSLAESIAWLKAHNVGVTVLGPIPQYDSPLPRLLALEIRNNDRELADRHHDSEVWKLDRQMADLARTTWHVKYVSLVDALCDRDRCIHYAEASVPIQYDYGHLTGQGSAFLAGRLKASGALELLSTMP
jgi:peptidoglycan/LPS O-acetylase OafA/YrhL